MWVVREHGCHVHRHPIGQFMRITRSEEILPDDYGVDERVNVFNIALGHAQCAMDSDL